MAGKAKIGAGLALDGEKEFKKAISGINKDLSVLGSEMGKVTAQFGSNANSMDSLKAKSEVYNKQIEEQKNKIETLKAALANSAEEFGENDVKTKNWQISLNKAEAELAKTENALTEVDKELNNTGKSVDDTSDKFSKFGGALKASAVAMAAVGVAAGLAAVQLGKAVLTAYADYEQLVGGIDTLFKESSGKMQEYASNAYKTAGLSANEYMDTVTSFSASLISSLGGDTEKSVKYADMAITDMSDNANKMGTDMALIQNSYQGFAKGNYGMLDNLKLGFGGTKTEMERLLVEAEKISGIKYDISSFADVTEAIHVIQESMGIAGTTALEAEHTITGSLDSMKSAWQNMLVGFGNADADVKTLTSNLVDAFSNVVTNVVPIIQNIAKALPDALGAMLPVIGQLLPDLLETVTSLFEEVLNALFEILPELIPVAVEAVLTIVDTLIENLPLIIDGAFELITALANGIVEALPELVPKIIEVVNKIVTTVTENLPLIIGVALQIIVALAGGLIQAIPELVKSVPQLIGAIVKAFSDSMNQIKDIGKNIVEGVWEGISKSAKWLLDKVREWCGSILKGIKAFFGIKSPSRVMAGIGENIGEGMANGIEDTKNLVVKSARTVGNALLKEEERIQKELADMDKAAIIQKEKESEQKHKEALDKKYAELAKANKKNQQKIYDDIAKLQVDREKEIADNSEKALRDSLNNQLKTIQDFKKDYEKALDDIQKSQENMSRKLVEFGGLFERTQNKLGRDIFKLTDLQKDIDMINSYGEALESLKDRGVSDSLLKEIEGMGIDDALDYTERLLSKTDESYEEYMALWEEKQASAKAVASKFYQDEMDSLQDEFVNKLPNELSNIKSEMRDIGINAGQGLANGFKSQASYIKDTFVNTLNSALAAAKSAMEIHSPSRKWAEVGKFMAAGLGQGFSAEMQNVAKRINSSIPTVSMSGQYEATTRMGEGIVNGLAGILPQQSNQPIIIQLVADGKTLAQTVYDPLNNIARQKGVPVLG